MTLTEFIEKKFPVFDPHWNLATQDAWFKGFCGVLRILETDRNEEEAAAQSKILLAGKIPIPGPKHDWKKHDIPEVGDRPSTQDRNHGLFVEGSAVREFVLPLLVSGTGAKEIQQKCLEKFGADRTPKTSALYTFKSFLKKTGTRVKRSRQGPLPTMTQPGRGGDIARFAIERLERGLHTNEVWEEMHEKFAGKVTFANHKSFHQSAYVWWKRGKLSVKPTADVRGVNHRSPSLKLEPKPKPPKKLAALPLEIAEASFDGEVKCQVPGLWKIATAGCYLRQLPRLSDKLAQGRSEKACGACPRYLTNSELRLLVAHRDNGFRFRHEPTDGGGHASMARPNMKSATA